MKNKIFTHMHFHSVYSVRDGLIKLEDAIQKTKHNNEAFVLTDHGIIAGWMEYFNLAKKHDVKPMFGVEIYLNQYRAELLNLVKQLSLTKDPALKKELTEKRDNIKKMHHLVLIAKNETGFYNIIQLVNEAYINYFYGKPMVDYDALFYYKDGLIVSSACLGSPLNYFFKNKRNDEAIEWVALMKENFGDDFYLEVQANAIDEQKKYNKFLIELAEKTKTKLILGSDSHYLDRSDADVHQDLLLLQNKKTREDLGKIDLRIVFENKNGEQKVKKFAQDKIISKTHNVSELKVGDVVGKNTVVSIEEVPRVWTFASEYNSLFSKDEAEEIIKKHHKELVPYMPQIFKSNYEIYDKVEHIKFDTNVKLPNIENASTRFVALIKDALKEKELVSKKYIDRVKYEMKIIKRFGFEAYFLILHDLLEWARSNNIALGAGRGSSSGSFIAYLLGIHRIDPFDKKWDKTGEGLPFARFLNMAKLLNKIIIENESGEKLEFLENDKVQVVRNNKKITIEAKDIQQDDTMYIE